MPYDSDRVKTRERLAHTTASIDAILQQPWMSAGREGLSPLMIITEIFGLDIRAGGELNALSDAQLEVLIPKAEACLSTLRVLQKYRMFPPERPWASYSAPVSG